ncbi:MAG TPA: TerB family tellurite resistance protein [Bacteroidota bacterium]|nr:TerB family tellurite resistance protein [Bacteroidota bacterium]
MDFEQQHSEETDFTAKMALCLAAITLVGIDGEFKEEELAKLRTLIHADETAFLKAYEFYNWRPLETCIEVIAAKLNEAQKRAAYRLMYDIAKADNEVVKVEEQLLRQYAKRFGWDEQTVAELSDVSPTPEDIALFE